MKLPASLEFIINVILIAINKGNDTHSYAVIFDNQREAVQVLISILPKNHADGDK